MGNICNHCGKEIKMEKAGDSIWMDTDKNEDFHDKCWWQIEKDHRVKKDGKRNTLYRLTQKSEYGGNEDYLMYNWNTNQWISVGMFPSKELLDSLGNHPSNNDNIKREREREQNQVNFDIL